MTQSRLAFTKMHGLGNDLVIINNLSRSLDTKMLPIQALANRYTGIGFDQLIVIEPSQQADVFCKIYNADGSEAAQCGNGLRCVARFIHETQLKTGKSYRLQTLGGIFLATLVEHDQICIQMGHPLIHHQNIRLPALSSYPITQIEIGNHHTIVRVESLHSLNITQLATTLKTETTLPSAINVGFMTVIDPHHLHLRTVEHGVGETQACGSNACAAVIAGITHQWIASPTEVHFPLGTLQITWTKNQGIEMTGPASRVFEGEMQL
jgi:diaminopimelate epimerase